MAEQGGIIFMMWDHVHQWDLVVGNFKIGLTSSLGRNRD